MGRKKSSTEGQILVVWLAAVRGQAEWIALACSLPGSLISGQSPGKENLLCLFWERALSTGKGIKASKDYCTSVLIFYSATIGTPGKSE